MKKLFLILLFLSPLLRRGAGGEVHAQTAPGIEWQNTIGGGWYDFLNSIQQTNDSGYILGGLSRSWISGDKTEDCNGDYDYWIVKTDSVGNIQWQNTIGGSDYDALYSIKQTKDGGYILGGISNSYISGDKTENSMGSTDDWIVKVDSVGNIQWQNTIGGTGGDGINSIQQTTDGGYLLAGSSTSNISGDKTENNWDTLCNPYCTADYWIVKTDSLGNIQWQNTIGGSLNDILHDAQQTYDAGYILVGESYSNISGDKTENNLDTICSPYCTSDIWVVKIDSAGNIEWQNTIGGNGYDAVYSVEQTSDRGYILGAQSQSAISGDKTEGCVGDVDYWIIKIDSVGNIQWQNTIGGTANDQVRSIQQTTDSGYILGGFSQSNISGDKTENTNGGIDSWAVKTDSTGNIQWQNTIGGSNGDYIFGIRQTMDGNYILGGRSDSDISGDKTENCNGSDDYWIIKLSFDTSTNLSPNLSPEERGVVIFPNPAKDEITISIPPLWAGQVGLTVFDVIGKQVLSQPITNLHSQIINLKSFASGVYYLQLNSGQQVTTARFVKM